jgi:hypothetical protein
MKNIIFNYANKTVVKAGVATATTTDKLVDTGGEFVFNEVVAGMGVVNTTNTTYCSVSARDSKTTLSVDVDIFTSGDGYSIYKDGDLMTWDESSGIIVTFQIGEFDADGAPVGALKGDGTQWLTLGTIVAGNITATPPTIVFNLASATDFAPSAYIRFKFDDGTTTKISGWKSINFMEDPITFFIIEDLVDAIGITAWIEGR